MPARGDTQPRGSAVPGTLNYVEGQVSLGSQPLNSKSIGSAVLESGQSITTENGKAEVLLTPGWSSLRSAYLAEANVDAAPGYIYADGFGPGWYGAGWYWDPWFSAYTFIPGDGIFYSPFGWGFYSPFFEFDAPFFFGDRDHFHHHFDHDLRGWGPGPHYAAGVRGGGFHAGHGYAAPQGGHASNGFRAGGGGHAGGFYGGGFHSGGFGGGGFSGGGFGGHGR